MFLLELPRRMRTLRSLTLFKEATMARVTVEDCIMHIPNRFELVIMAAQRAKQIASGTPLTIDRDNDKDAVVSLREIADLTLDLGQMKEDIIQSFCKRQMSDAPSRSDSA